MTCREASDFLTDYLSGELPGPTHQAFESHLAICPNCRVFLDQFKHTIQAGAAAFPSAETPAGEALPEDLVSAILSAMKR